MNRNYSHSSEEVSWSRSKGNVGIATSNDRCAVLRTPLDRPQGRDSKCVEEEEIPRKRIRVACSRCRKRKIKCSGPIGGKENPCSNCKNSGTATSCAFELNGSMRIDFEELRMRAPRYPYEVLPTTTNQPIYFHGQIPAGLGNSLGAYPAPNLPRYRQEVVHGTYAHPGSQPVGHGNYNTAVSYASYPGSWDVLSLPVQTTDQQQSTPWNVGYQPGYHTYDDLHRVSNPIHQPMPPPPPPPLSAANQSQAYTIMNDNLPALLERTLPLPAPIPARSLSTILVQSDAGHHGSWSSSNDTYVESVSSRNSSHDGSSTQSSSGCSESLLEVQQELGQDHGRTTFVRAASPAPEAAIFHDPPQPPYSHPHYQLFDRWERHYSEPVKPPPRYSSPMHRNSTVGNYVYANLPHREIDAKPTSLKYEIHEGVLKAPSKIAADKARAASVSSGKKRNGD